MFGPPRLVGQNQDLIVGHFIRLAWETSDGPKGLGLSSELLFSLQAAAAAHQLAGLARCVAWLIIENSKPANN